MFNNKGESQMNNLKVEVIKKLNELEKYKVDEIKKGWQTQYYTLPMTL